MILDILYAILIQPIEWGMGWVFTQSFDFLHSYGLAIILLSLVVNIALIPIYLISDNWQAQERAIQERMRSKLDEIKLAFAGQERFMMTRMLYKINHYHPLMAVRSSIGLLIQIPFFFAAYQLISNYDALNNVSFFIFSDLSKPDGLLSIGSWHINLMPFVMTAINLASAYVYASNLSKKDKIQVYVIAGIFLIVLYSMPVALVLYWTMNNVFSLVKNILYKPGKKHTFLNSIFKRINIKYSVFLLIFVFVFTILFYSPLERYIFNITDFWFGFNDVVFSATVSTFVVFICISFIVLFLSLFAEKAIRIITTLLLATALAWFIQGTFLNPSFRVLDGTAINWSDYSFHNILSIFVWLSAYIFAVFYLRDKEKLKISISYIFLSVQILSLIFSTLEVTNAKIKEPEYLVSDQGLYDVSAKNNIVVFVLDAFDAQTFKELYDTETDISNWFSGFTWYPDTVAAATRTKISIPLMLSGIPYLEPVSYSEYKSSAYESSKLFKTLANNNVDAGIYTSGAYASLSMNNAVSNIFNEESVITSYVEFAKLLYTFSAFTYMPQPLKEYFWLYTGDFDSLRASNSEELTPYRIDDVAYYKKLIKEDLRLNRSDSTFRFIHMMGPHAPFTMNSRAKRVEKSTEHEQAMGALFIVHEYLKRMKQLGVYDQATIVITSDHGLRGKEQNPLFMVKNSPNDKSGSLHVSDARTSHAILNKCLIDAVKEQNLNSCLDNSFYAEEDERYFYIEHSSNNSSEIAQYATRLHAKKHEQFYRTGITNDLSSRKYAEYVIGDVLDFMSDGNGNQYTIIGFSKNEASHTWTDGNLSEIKLPISTVAIDKNTLQLEMKFDVFNGSQNLTIEVNDRNIFEGFVSGNDSPLKLYIPSSIAKEHIHIRLLLPDAISPYELGQSNDRRKLALAFKSLILNYIELEKVKVGENAFENPVSLWGWSAQEPTHRWTEGNQAGLLISLDDHKFGDLLLGLHGSGYLGGGLSHQDIVVSVNGAQVASWEMAGLDLYQATIPAELVPESGELNIVFDISDPKAPCDVGESTDCRKLGMSVQDILIDYVK